MDKKFFDEYFNDDDRSRKFNFDSDEESDDDEEQRDKNSGKTFTKGFLTALAICLVAIGASVWTTVKNVNSYLNPEISITPSVSTDNDKEDTGSMVSFIVDDAQVNAQVSGVKKDKTGNNDKVVFTFEPINGAEVITAYSEEPVYNKTLDDYRAHPAVDYAASIDDKVRAMGSGVVKDIYYDEMYGNTVVIEHSDSVESYYCGLARTALVQKGEVIEAGTFVGTVYAIPCETADRAHIHIAVKENGNWVDPDKFMKSNERN